MLVHSAMEAGVVVDAFTALRLKILSGFDGSQLEVLKWSGHYPRSLSSNFRTRHRALNSDIVGLNTRNVIFCRANQ